MQILGWPTQSNDISAPSSLARLNLLHGCFFFLAIVCKSLPPGGYKKNCLWNGIWAHGGTPPPILLWISESFAIWKVQLWWQDCCFKQMYSAERRWSCPWRRKELIAIILFWKRCSKTVGLFTSSQTHQRTKKDEIDIFQEKSGWKNPQNTQIKEKRTTIFKSYGNYDKSKQTNQTAATN